MIVYNNRVLRVLDRWLRKEGYNPLNLPPYNIRCMFETGYTPTQGTYRNQVSVTPNIWDIYEPNTSWYNLFNGETHLLEVLGANSTDVTSMNAMFDGCTNLYSVALFDTSNVIYMTSMFSECSSLKTVPLYDTSNVTSMNAMFYECTSLEEVPLFNTSNVLSARNMFYECSSLKTVPFFDTSSVQDVQYMFYHCSSLETIPAFDFENVYTMYSFCQGCSSLRAIPALNVPSLGSAGAWYGFTGCRKVASGALALYEQLSAYLHPYYNNGFFYECGWDTETGLEEWRQIPTYWGGGKSNGNLY